MCFFAWCTSGDAYDSYMAAKVAIPSVNREAAVLRESPDIVFLPRTEFEEGAATVFQVIANLWKKNFIGAKTAFPTVQSEGRIVVFDIGIE